MARKNGKVRHANLLVPSGEWGKLAFIVQDNFLDLCSTYLRVTGNELVFPEHLGKDVLRWREMIVRHRKGDFRHTESELRSVKAIAQWTLDIKCEITGNDKKQLKWGEPQ